MALFIKRMEAEQNCMLQNAYITQKSSEQNYSFPTHSEASELKTFISIFQAYLITIWSHKDNTLNAFFFKDFLHLRLGLCCSNLCIRSDRQ